MSLMRLSKRLMQRLVDKKRKKKEIPMVYTKDGVWTRADTKRGDDKC